MRKLIGILGLIVTLATMIVAPVQEANAAVAAATSPMMQMADGAPCNSQSCAKMPDCPMALPCMSVPTGLVGLSAKLGFQPAAQIVRFAFMAHADMSSVEGGGLRRPPKI